MKCYLLVCSPIVGEREKIIGYLNAMPEVATWRYDIPYCYYVISNTSAKELSDSFRQMADPNGHFLFSEIGFNHSGWLSPDTWYLINNKTHKPK